VSQCPSLGLGSSLTFLLEEEAEGGPRSSLWSGGGAFFGVRGRFPCPEACKLVEFEECSTLMLIGSAAGMEWNGGFSLMVDCCFFIMSFQ